MSGDSISRKAVIDEMYDLIGAAERLEQQIVDVLERVSSEMPPAEPERKTGKWIEFDSGEERYDVIKCPYCKHIFTVDSYHWTDIGFVKDDFKFCPMCGAKMEGE